MGVSGDMLLGALDQPRGALGDWPRLTASLPFEVRGSSSATDVNGLSAVQFLVEASDPQQPQRRLAGGARDRRRG